LRLAKEKCSLIGTICQNRREIPEVAKQKQLLHQTLVFKATESTGVTLTTNQCKKSKSVILLSTLHPSFQVEAE